MGLNTFEKISLPDRPPLFQQIRAKAAWGWRNLSVSTSSKWYGVLFLVSTKSVVAPDQQVLVHTFSYWYFLTLMVSFPVSGLGGVEMCWVSWRLIPFDSFEVSDMRTSDSTLTYLTCCVHVCLLYHACVPHTVQISLGHQEIQCQRLASAIHLPKNS